MTVEVASPALIERTRSATTAVIVQELFEKDKSMSVGETMAMTLAEVGEFEQAAQIQRGVLSAATRPKRGDMVPRLESNLRLYERRRPYRAPWRNDEPVFLPTPMI